MTDDLDIVARLRHLAVKQEYRVRMQRPDGALEKIAHRSAFWRWQIALETLGSNAGDLRSLAVRTAATCREAASTIEGLREAVPPSRDALVPGYGDTDAPPPRREIHRRWLLRIAGDLGLIAVGIAIGAGAVMEWICGG